MSLLGAPAALFPAVSSLVGLIDPSMFNGQLLAKNGAPSAEDTVGAIGAGVRSGKASVPIDALVAEDTKTGRKIDANNNGQESDNLVEAFLNLKLPVEMRQLDSNKSPSSLAEVLESEAAAANAANDDGSSLTVPSNQQASSSTSNNNNSSNNPLANVSNLLNSLNAGLLQQQSTSSSSSSNNNNGNRFDLAGWFRRQANGVRQAVQQGQQQAQNFWLGGFRRPFRNRNNLPENYFVRTPFAWRMLVPYGFLMNFLSWATPLDIPRFLPLADAATFLGESANPFMGFMFLGSLFLHLAEAGVAYALSRSYGLNYETSFAWFLQTLGFGMFSLQYLLFPDQRYMQRIDGDVSNLASFNLIDYLEGF